MSLNKSKHHKEKRSSVSKKFNKNRSNDWCESDGIRRNKKSQLRYTDYDENYDYENYDE